MRMTVCENCGTLLMPIETKDGVIIHCNTLPVQYRTKPGGDFKIVTKDGDVVCCEPFVDLAEATGWGYVPHRVTCNAHKKFRKKENKTK